MAELLSAVEARLVAILESARGASGLGAHATELHLAAGLYRRSDQSAPLRDAAYPVAAFDRAYELEWLDDGDAFEPPNDLDGAWPADVRLDVHVGFVYGAAYAAFSVVQGGESQATNVLAARRRALGDGRRISLALCCNDLVQGGTSPEITAVQSAGKRVTTDLGEGRLLVTIPLLVRLWVVGAFAP